MVGKTGGEQQPQRRETYRFSGDWTVNEPVRLLEEISEAIHAEATAATLPEARQTEYISASITALAVPSLDVIPTLIFDNKPRSRRPISTVQVTIACGHHAVEY